MMSCVIRTKAPPLLPLFRSRLQAELLARLFLAAPEGESISELGRRLAVDAASVQREVSRLEQAGVLTSTRVGRTRIVRPDPGSPIHRELAALLEKAFGPAPLLEEQLARIDGVHRAFIFGSWARRFHGESGRLPHDIDLLVVGSPDPNEVYRAARNVDERLGIEINPIIVDDAEWSRPNGLVARVKREPLVELAVAGAVDR
jgi:predicted nucleotidyltransferase